MFTTQKRNLELMKEEKKSMSKINRVLRIFGSFILIVMAMFHGSGLTYITETIEQSNTEGFLKEIVPVLFAHPSIHLIGLSAFGVLSLFLGNESKKVLFLLALLVITDALLAFYLGGLLPGILLFAAAFCFLGGNYSARHSQYS